MPSPYVLGNLKDEETTGTFYEKEMKKTNQKEEKKKKVIKR